MDILKKLFIILLIVFSLGELTRIQLADSIAINLNDIFVFVFVLSWIVKKIIKRDKFKKPFLFLPITIFFVLSIVTLFFNVHRLSINEFFVSLLYPLRWLLYSGVYFAFMDFDKEFKKKMTKFLLIPISLVILIGFVQSVFYQNLRNLYYLGWDEHLYRLFSGFLDPNFAGVFLVLAFIFLLGLIFQGKNTQNKLLLVLAGLNLLAIYLTYSRTALLGLIAGAMIFLYFKINKKYLIIVLIFLLLLVLFIPKSFQTEGTNLFRTASTEQRIKSAQIAIQVFKDNPVLGVGFNSYRYYQKEHGFIAGSLWQVSHAGSGTDNSFLLILATTGILGFISYLYLLYKMFLLGKPKNQTTKLVLFTSLTVFCISGLFINVLFYTFLMEWIWIILAVTENN